MDKNYCFKLFFFFYSIIGLWPLHSMETMRVQTGDEKIKNVPSWIKELPTVKNQLEDINGSSEIVLPELSQQQLEEYLNCYNDEGKIDEEYCKMLSPKKLMKRSYSLEYLGDLELRNFIMPHLEKICSSPAYARYYWKDIVIKNVPSPCNSMPGSIQEEIAHAIQRKIMDTYFPYTFKQSFSTQQKLPFEKLRLKDNILISVIREPLKEEKHASFAVWNLENQEHLFTADQHTKDISQLALNDKYIISGSKDGAARIWDIKNGKCIHTLSSSLTPPDRPVVAVDIDATCDQAISGSKGPNVIMLWDIREGKNFRAIPAKVHQKIQAVGIGENIFATIFDKGKKIKVADVRAEGWFRKFTIESASLNKINMTDHMLVSYSRSGELRAYNLFQGMCVNTFKENMEPGAYIEDIAPDKNECLIGINKGNALLLWDMKRGSSQKIPYTFNNPRDNLVAVAFHNGIAVAASDQGTVFLGASKMTPALKKLGSTLSFDKSLIWHALLQQPQQKKELLPPFNTLPQEIQMLCNGSSEKKVPCVSLNPAI
jgi:hypothetical protein